jgi:hypothetical protein
MFEEACKKLMANVEASREEDKTKLANALSHCSSILDLPPEAVIALLQIPRNDLWKLQNALEIAQENKLEFSSESMSELLDLARVARVMEEDEPVNRSRGVTGPTGPTGPQGAQGATGPTGRMQIAGQAQHNMGQQQVKIHAHCITVFQRSRRDSSFIA